MLIATNRIYVLNSAAINFFAAVIIVAGCYAVVCVRAFYQICGKSFYSCQFSSKIKLLAHNGGIQPFPLHENWCTEKMSLLDRKLLCGETSSRSNWLRPFESSQSKRGEFGERTFPRSSLLCFSNYGRNPIWSLLQVDALHCVVISSSNEPTKCICNFIIYQHFLLSFCWLNWMSFFH